MEKPWQGSRLVTPLYSAAAVKRFFPPDMTLPPASSFLPFRLVQLRPCLSFLADVHMRESEKVEREERWKGRKPARC